MIKFHSLAVTLCTLARCRAVLGLGYLVPALLTLPNFLSLSLTRTEETHRKEPLRNITVYRIQASCTQVHF
jgi:hypothetical protein